MSRFGPESPEFKAYNEGWNGERLGNAGEERPYVNSELQRWVEKGHMDSQANHGFGNWDSRFK